MRKGITILLCLISFLQMNAQNRYYVANSNGTYQAIATDDTHEMVFDAEQKLVAIKLTNGITSQFATNKVDSISLLQPAGAKELTYTEEFGVAFDESDLTSYKEIVETIITDEANEESGDFIENYSPSKIVNITFSETGVTVKIGRAHV